jgi:Flp pilus assembly protein TadG
VSGRAVGRLGGEHGDSGALEAAILVPVVLAMFALVVAYGRTTQADTKVEHAAAVGARAAAAAQTAGGGAALAGQVVAESLRGAGLSCTDRSITVDGEWSPGGRVTVAVSCVASLADLTGLGLPLGSRTLRATATEVIDVNRGGAP